MRLIAIGRMKKGPERDLFERYAARLRPRLEMTEISESRGSAQEIRRKDAAALLSACPPNALVVALDEGGATPDSLGFSGMVERWLESGRPLCFVIGGAEGLDASLIERADATLSLGKLTWPHMLVRGLLAEQIYRARAISANHPYHRAARP
ncbi:23S rRNA (pseudouridine(1915)-N(3))-methyltransferase RlmH [Kozakia baliensis]|uniref:23S rRNA (pseudouridine(1915)-N(3))-methyltransferase RlmH n=1 Tax=Kozakia baliensis TaxID=153496 RepID=UPI00345B5DE5